MVPPVLIVGKRRNPGGIRMSGTTEDAAIHTGFHHVVIRKQDRTQAPG
jgi:hypothetical protein